MALNFGVLQTATPVSAFFQGRQDVAQNMLAQQKMAQEQEMNALRRQQAQVEMEGARLGQERTRGLMAATEEDRARARRLERTGMFRDRLLRAATPEAAREIVKMQYADPDLAPVLSQAGTLDQALAEVPDDPVQFQTYRQQEAMGMSEWMKSQLPKVTPLGVFDPATRQYLMPPPKPEKPEKPATSPAVADYMFARTPEGGGFQGSYMEFLAGKQQPQAPVRLRRGESLVSRQGETITSLPPAPPRAGAAASAAPSAKPPTAAQVAKDKRMEEARQALSKDIETQLGYYKKLADIGAMTSPTRTGAENVLAYARSSGLGQQLERAIGTDAQTLRDNIKNTRQRLFMQIKDATGATAGQMNSNVEMQAWLNSMTDPQQSIETVQETLKQMDSVIAGVRRQVEQERAAKEPQAKPATAAPAPAPTPGRRDLGGGFKLVD